MKMISKLAIGAVAATLAMGVVAADAKNLKVQASSKAGDWAHRFMTDTYGPKLKAMTGGAVSIEVLPTKAVVPHRETIDAVANGMDGAALGHRDVDGVFAVRFEVGLLTVETLADRVGLAVGKRRSQNDIPRQFLARGAGHGGQLQAEPEALSRILRGQADKELFFLPRHHETRGQRWLGKHVYLVAEREFDLHRPRLSQRNNHLQVCDLPVLRHFIEHAAILADEKRASP